MTHDPLCRWHGSTEFDTIDGCDECDLIANVRKETLAAAVQRVEALAWDYTDSRGELITRAKAIAAIKGEQ